MEKSSGILTLAKLVSVAVAIGVVSYLVFTAQKATDKRPAAGGAINSFKDGGLMPADSKGQNDASRNDDSESEFRPTFVPSSKSGILHLPRPSDREVLDDEAIFMESSKVGIIYRRRDRSDNDASVQAPSKDSDAGSK